MRLLAVRGRIYHNFYTPELWAQVNKENKRIMDDFLQEYKQRKMSKGTISGYHNDLRIIMIYILKELDNRCVLELKKKDFRNLSLYFTEECEMSAARTNRLKSAINSLLTFCEDDDDYDYEINYAKKVHGIPKSRVKDDDDDFFFTFDEFIKVRDILVSQEKWQLAVLWSIGFDSAGRKNELFQIQKHGLLDGNKTNIVVGKRGKKFPLVYLDDTKELIRKYLEWRGDDTIDSLWIKGCGDNKQPLSDSNVLYDRIVSISKILSEVRGEPCNIFTHTMRHSRLECLSQGTDLRLLDKNGNPKKFPLEQVQVFAHHSDPSTTQGYLKDHSEDTINSMFGI
nr:MAG TPA: Integrase [Bacteriophage sp.]